jgi:hypothetical protein
VASICWLASVRAAVVEYICPLPLIFDGKSFTPLSSVVTGVSSVAL